MKKIFSLLVLAFTMAMGMQAETPANPDVLLPPGQRNARVRDNGDRVSQAPQQHFDFEEYLKRKCDAVVAEMGLTPQETERFVPLYRELQKKKGELFRKYGGSRRVRHMIEQGQEVADTTLLRVVNNQAKLLAEDAQLEQSYVERFSKVLTPLQLYKLQQAEQKFKTEMMKRGKPARK